MADNIAVSDIGGLILLSDFVDYSAIANGAIASANTFSLVLAEAAAGIAPPTIAPEFPTGPSAPALLTTTQPELQTIVWTSPAMPASFLESLNVSDILPAPFDDSPPELFFPSAPAPFAETAPDAPGVDLTYADPGLTVDLPATPSLIQISVTPFGGMNLPTIDPDAIPVLNITEPSIREYVPGAQYTSALLTNLKSYLNDVVVNGGTGLDPNVENAIWDRGREREARSRADALRDLDKMEEMGFALPPGVYLDARLKIATESDMTNRGLSREIMIKQAELSLDAIKMALTTSTDIEAKCMDYSNAVEQRLFEATKYATEAGIAIYNAKVQAYAAYLDAYKTKVQIYVAQIQAETAKVEAYKAEVEAEQVKAQINHELVEQYKAGIEAAMSSVEIYKARLEGIQIKANIEKTKIDIYGTQVQAYAAKINAYTAGIEGYRAQIQAEGAKQQVYQSRVEAYSAQVGADAKVIDARIAAFRGQLDAWLGQWEGYKAQISGEASKAQAISAYNQSVSTEFAAEVQAITSYNEVLTKEWQVALDQAQRVSDIALNAAKANAELYVTTRSLAVDAAKVGAQVSAQVAASALNAFNWSTSFNNSRSYGASKSEGWEHSDSKSESNSTSYIYSASI